MMWAYRIRNVLLHTSECHSRVTCRVSRKKLHRTPTFKHVVSCCLSPPMFSVSVLLFLSLSSFLYLLSLFPLYLFYRLSCFFTYLGKWCIDFVIVANNFCVSNMSCSWFTVASAASSSLSGSTCVIEERETTKMWREQGGGRGRV